MHIFSIIIPHHEIPMLLQRCLDSIPDVPEVQVIVVDDNSSEQKVDFGQFPGLNRKYTLCIFDKEGGGAGHARNIGLRHADGKWLVFADSDDFFTKDAFHILNSHKDAPYDILLFKSNSVNSEDLSPSNRFADLNNAIDEALTGKKDNKAAILSRPGPVCKMFRRSHIQQKDIWFDETMASNDQMFVFKATCWAQDDAVAVFNETLYTVTTRKGSLIEKRFTNPDNFLCRMEVQIRCNKFLRDYPQFRKEPIIIWLSRSRRFGIKTFLRTLGLIISRGAFFSGFGTLMKIVKSHIIRKEL
ncbi:MAG: glycosyltransferase family 2 protein [Bacteroidaceae bacterium]|nr:glycosyltransferase family 2 protein [Bacteroidaceae bacterium]